MGEVFLPRSTAAPAKNLHRATFFTVLGTTKRPLVCAAYEVETGLELRLTYADNSDVMRSELFRGVDREERVAEAADAWRLLLLEKGFTEVEG
jgi:hypothetical protein